MVFTTLKFFLFLVAQVLQFFKTDCFLNWDMIFLTEIWLQEGKLIKPEFCVERQFPIWIFFVSLRGGGGMVQINPLGYSCSMRF